MSKYKEYTQARLETLEKRLAIAKAENDTCQWTGIPAIEKNIESCKRSLDILNSDELKKATADMKIILSHTNAVDDKYNCRSVKAMFAIADFLDKPRCFSKSLATWIREYTINKINAPVCSIVSSPKPELAPMPGYMDPVATEREERYRKERAELIKYRDLWVNYAEAKPTFKERMKLKVYKFTDKVLR